MDRASRKQRQLDRKFENLRKYAAEEDQYLTRSSSRSSTSAFCATAETSSKNLYAERSPARSFRSPSSESQTTESAETRLYRDRSAADTKSYPVFIAIQDYIPDLSAADAISLDQGQIVEVLDNKNPSSWLVRTKAQPPQTGWVPASLFETPSSFYKHRKQTRELLESESQNLTEEQKALLKREQVYHDLLRTEEEFVGELRFVIDNYVSAIKNPSAPQGVSNLGGRLVLNLRELYTFHSNVMLKGLNYYSDDPGKVGKTFVRLEKDFEQHVAFLRELPSLVELIDSTPIVDNFLQNLSVEVEPGARTFLDHMKMVSVRINQYEEFMKEIIKYTTRAQCDTNVMQKALELIQSISKRAQEIEFTKNFINYPGDIRRLGRIFRHDLFHVWEGDEEPREKYVFLFRNKLIFMDRDSRTDPPTFKHYSTIRVDRYTIRQHTSDPNSLVLIPNEPGLPSFRIAAKDQSSQAFVFQAWFKDIIEMQDALGPEEGPPRKKVKSPPVISPTGSSTSLYSIGGGSSIEWSTTGTSLEMQGSRVTRTQYGFRTLQESSAKMCLKVSGYPLPIITWYKDDKLITEDERHAFYSDDDGFFALTIDPVQTEDTGRYSCVATNEYGQASTSAFFRVLKVEKEAAPPNFTTLLKDQFCKESDVVNFHCEVDGWPEPELVWLVDDQLLRPSHDFRIQYDGQKSSLEIRDAQADDTGTYTVRISNDYGIRESQCKLTVEPDPDKNHIAPEFQAVIEDVDCEEGDTVKFKSVLTGDPDPEVVWYVNGIPLTESEKIRFISEDGICILTIQDVTRHFDGIVTCQGKNRLGTANCDARLRVRVPPVPPQFEKPLEDRIVTENSAVMFEVDVIGYPEPKVEFFLKGRPLIHGREGVDIKQIEQHYQLTIQNCQIDNHDGEIMAKATNDHGQAESRARLTVEMEEEESRSAPTFIKDLEDQTVKFGQEATFDTIVRGFPTPVVSWYLNGAKMDQSSPGVVAIRADGNEHKIILDSAHCAGTVTCRAENSIGRFETNARLIVLPSEKRKHPPAFRQPLVDKTEIEGSTAVFEVTVDAEPSAQFKWILNGNELRESERIHFREFEGSSKLELINCSLTDAGTLECIAFNSEGEASTRCQLKVNRQSKAPHFDKKPGTQQIEKGSEAVFEAHADAVPEAEYQWSVGGRRVFPTVEGIKIEYDSTSGISRLRVDTSIPLFSESATVSVIALNSYGTDECGARMIVTEPTQKSEMEPPVKKARQDSDSDTLTESQVTQIATTLPAEEAMEVDQEGPGGGMINSPFVTGIPKIERGLPKEVTVSEKEQVELSTIISGEPKPNIRWMINEKLVESGDENIKITETPAGSGRFEEHIRISETSEVKHSGQVKVVAENIHGSTQSTTVLTVNKGGEGKPYFNKTPQDHEVYEGEESIKFSAIVFGSPTPTVSWYLKEEKLTSTEHIRIKHDMGAGKTSIRIFQPTKSDSGQVRVRAENIHGYVEATSNLSVDVKPGLPKFLSDMEDKHVHDGDNVKFIAKIDGIPEPEVVWTFNGEPIKHENVKISKEGNTHILEIAEVTPDQAGEYGCAAKNTAGTKRQNAKLVVKEFGNAPTFLKTLEDRLVEQHETLVLQAQLSPRIKPKPVIRWLRDGHEIKSDDHWKLEEDEQTSSVKLTVVRIEMQDKGRITCQAENKHGSAETSANVGVEQRRGNAKPKFLSDLGPITVNEGDSLNARVLISGDPPPYTKWYINNTMVYKTEDTDMTNEGGVYSLTIHGCTTDMTGKIKCVAGNKMGEATIEGKLSVIKPTPVEFETGLCDATCREGDTLRLKAVLLGEPMPAVTWYINGKKLEEGQKIKIHADKGTYTVTIKDITCDYSGLVVCEAVNEYGKASSQATLKVLPRGEPPDFLEWLANIRAREGSTVEHRVVYTGEPRPTITWFINNKEIKDSEEISIRTDANTSVLTIKSFNPDKHVGEIICKAENDAGEVSCTANMATYTSDMFTESESASMTEEQREEFFEGLEDTRQETFRTPTPIMAPAFITKIKDTRAQRGHQAIFECVVPDTKGVCCKWLKDGKEIELIARIRVQMQTIEGFTTSELVVEDVTPEDAGRYAVVVENEAGTVQCEATLTVVETLEQPTLQPPEFIIKLQDKVANISDKVVFECKVSSLPESEISWYRGDEKLIEEPDKIKIESDCNIQRLIIESVAKDHEGRYICVAENVVGRAETSGNLKVEALAPEFTRPITDQMAQVGGQIIFECSVKGIPQPVVEFYTAHDNFRIQTGTRVSVQHDESNTHWRLVITNAVEKDFREYYALAKNLIGEARCQAKVEEAEDLEKPRIIEGLKRTRVRQKETTEMAIRIAVSGKGPPPTVEWFKNGEPVQPGDRIELVEYRDTGIYKIVIREALVSDAGEYGVRVTNKVGTDQSKAPLEVEELVPPEFVEPLHDTSANEAQTAIFSVVVTGKPEPEVQWKREGYPIEVDGNHFIVKKEDGGRHTLTVIKVEIKDAGAFSCEAKNEAGSAQTKANFAVIENVQAPKFVKGLEPLEVKESETVSMSVVAEGKPTPQVDWFKDGRPIQIDETHLLKKDEGEGRHSLTIFNSRLDDAGIYSCKAVNKAGADETSAKFAVIEDLEPPRFTDGLKPVEINEGETANMSVQVTGKPEPNVEWRKDGYPVGIDGEHIIAREGPNKGEHSITVKNANLGDAGSYSCKAVNKAGSDETRANFGVIEDLESPKFTDGLKPVEIKEGESATMSVTATGKPEPEIQWFKDGRPVQIDGEHIIAKDGPQKGQHSIAIKNSELEDAGTYSCKAVNKAGSDETRANFAVVEELEAPYFTERLGEVETEQGQNVRLECTVIGKPEPDVQWLFNGQPVNIDNSHFIAQKDAKGHHSLTINNARAEDAGKYSCEAVNKAGKDETTGLLKFPKYVYETQPEEKVQPIVVETFEEKTAKEVPTGEIAPGPPEFVELLKSATTTIGGTAVLRCKVRGNPRPTITWIKQGGDVINESEQIHLEYHDDGTIILTLKNATVQDTGEYRCEAENDYGSAWTEGPIIVALQDQMPTDGEAPDFLEPVRPITVKVGDTGILEGKVCGMPSPEIKWYKGSEEIIPGSNPRYRLEKHPDGTQRLIVTNAQMDDMDDYRCEASNKYGDVWSDVTMTVVAPTEEEVPMEAPTVIKGLEEVTAREGESVELECAFKGHPMPEIKWYKDSKEIFADGHFKTSLKDGTAKLNIPSAAMGDAGIFRCEARNPAGMARTEAPLKVLPAEIAPKFVQDLKPVQAKEGEPAVFECRVSGFPQPQVKWYKNGEEIVPGDGVKIEAKPDGTQRLIIDKCKLDDQGDYRCDASNPAGTISSKAPLTVIPDQRLKLIRGLEDQEVPEGVKIQLSVEVEGLPKTVKWFHGSEEISESDTTHIRKLTNEEYLMEIENAQLSDSGTFRVVLSNDVNTIESFCKVTVYTEKPEIRKGLTDQCLPKGSKLVMEVEVDGKPKSVKWLRDGRPIDSDGAKMDDLGNGKYRLTIPELCDDNDFGRYSVQLSNDAGSAESAANVTEKEEKPEIVSGLKPLRIKPGERAQFEVQTRNPVREVKWYKNGKLMDNPRTEQPDGTHFRLIIPDASFDDEAEYKVVLSNAAGSADSSAPLTIIQPIRFVQPLSDKTVKAGETTALEAETDRPPKVIKWYKNGEEIGPGKTGPGNKFSLEIPNAGKDDEAKYTVVVSDEDGQTADSSCALTVILPGPTAPPRFIRPLVDQTIPEEDELMLEVEIAEKPHTVKWYRNGAELEPGKTPNIQVEKVNDAVFRLTIPRSLVTDSGDYAVEATNDIGSAKCSAKIIVEPVPEFIRPLKDVEVVEGQPAEFNCLTNLRSPPHTIRWFKDSQEIKADNRIDMVSELRPEGTEFKLRIKSSIKDDIGLYKILLENTAGRAESSAKLNVLSAKREPPRITRGLIDQIVAEGEPLIFEIDVEGDVDEIKWLKDGQPASKISRAHQEKIGDKTYRLTIPSSEASDAGKFEVQAINSAGKADSSAKAEVDLPPRIVKGLVPAEIDEGDDHVFRVEVSNPVREVKWYKNGEEIRAPAGARLTMKELSPKKYELEINNAELNDGASYKVILSNRAGACDSSADLKVLKPDLLKLLKGLEDATVDENQPLELSCKIQGTPATIKWYKDGKEIVPDEHVQLKSNPSTGEYSLLIPNAVAADAGAYKVVFTSARGDEIPSSCVAQVRPKRLEKVGKPAMFLSPLQDVTIPEGETLTLNCQVAGEPLPEMKWFREGTQLTSDDRISIRLSLDGKAVLRMRDARKSDAGQFRVEAFNEAGSAESTCQVRVISGDELPCPPKFIIPLKRTEGVPGESATFPVKVRGVPSPELVWHLNGVIIDSKDRFEIEELGDGSWSLTINDVKESDFGTLRCVATNEHGSDECEAPFVPSADWLAKQKEKEGYPPKFNVPLWDRRVPEGHPMFIECHVDANPRAEIEWTKDGVLLKESEGLEIENTPDGACRLRIPNFMKDDVGLYKCQAKNKYGVADTRANLNVEIEEPEEVVEKKEHPPKFNPGLDDVSINAGEPLKLYCRVIAVPKATIMFYKDGLSLKSTDRIKIDYDEESGDCRLTIDSAEGNDAGAYRCVATNPLGSTNTSCQVGVKEKKEEVKKEGAEPMFTKGLVDQYVDRGETLTFKCAVTGDPEPEIKWFKNGQLLRPSDRIEIDKLPDGQCILTIKDAQIADEGIYRCEASNPHGTARTQATGHVEVRGKVEKPKMEEGEAPRFIIPLEDLSVFMGSAIEFDCKVIGIPMPTIKWTKDGRPLVDDSRFEWDNDPANGTYRLRIRDSTRFDEGTYRAIATNEHGQATSKGCVKIDDGGLKKPIEALGLAPSISARLTDVRVLEGEPLKLHCRVAGDPKPELVWYKDGEQIRPSDRLQLEHHDDGNAYLIIPKCTLNDDGIYRVIATNPHGSAYDKCTAYVKKAPTEEIGKAPEAGAAPKVIMPLENVRIPEKDEFVLRCKFSGEPKPNIKWFKDGERIFPYDHVQITELEDGTCELRVPSSIKRDAGNYRCIAENPHGTAQTSGIVSVIAKERRPKDLEEQIKEMGLAPGFTIPLTVKHAKPGDKVIFECLPYGKPFPAIKWLKDGIEIIPGDGIQIEALPDGTQRLVLDNVDFPSEGYYRCVATNEHGTASTKAELILHGERKPAKIEEEIEPKESKPRIRPGLYNQTVHQGRPVEMQICALGFPTPTVQWFKDGQPIASDAEGPGARITIMKDERGIHHLVITNAQQDDEGEYSVVATNPLGEAVSTGHLGVIMPREVEQPSDEGQKGPGYPPGFIRQLKNKHVFSKMPTIFDCLVTGNPKPDVEWYHNGKLIVPDSRIKIQSVGGSPNTGFSHALLIQDTCLEDAGEYVAIAKNAHGSASSSAILDVTVPFLDKIKFDGSVDVTPYLGEEYGFKKQRFKSIPTPPDRGPFIKEVTGHYLTLSWIPTKRSPPRYPQVTYIVEIRELPYREWTLLDYNIPEPVCKVRNLELGKSYQFRVRAENIYGVSDPSPPSPPSRLMARPPPVLDKNKRVIPLLDPYAERALDRAHAEQYACTPWFAPGVLEKRFIGENETASITLCYSGYPDPKIIWKHRGWDIDEKAAGSNVRISTRLGSDTTITFLAFKRENAGQYTCVASNQYGEAQQNVMIEIATRPKFTQGLSDRTFTNNRSLKLDVHVEGSPFPEIKWLKDWRPLAESSRIHFVQDISMCSLVIDQVIWSDAGIYSCIAINDAGQSVTSCMITVEADTFDGAPIPRKRIMLEKHDLEKIYEVPETNGIPSTNGNGITV